MAKTTNSRPDNLLAKRLRSAVNAAGLSMLQVSKQTGIPYKSVHAFISGYGDMTLASGSKIAELFGLELKPAKPKK